MNNSSPNVRRASPLCCHLAQQIKEKKTKQNRNINPLKGVYQSLIRYGIWPHVTIVIVATELIQVNLRIAVIEYCTTP